MRWTRWIAFAAPLLVPLGDDCGDDCNAEDHRPTSTDADSTPNTPEPGDAPDPAPVCRQTYGGFELPDGVDNDCNGAIDDFATSFTANTLPVLVDNLENLLQEDNESTTSFLNNLDVVFAPDGALVWLRPDKRVLFLGLDGALRGGNSRPITEGTTHEYPGSFFRPGLGLVDLRPELELREFAFLIQGRDMVIGAVLGAWSESVPGSADDRFRNGTTLFEIDPQTGARRDVLARLDDVFLIGGQFSADDRLVALGFDGINVLLGRGEDADDEGQDDELYHLLDPILYVDALGERIELDGRGIHPKSIVIEPEIGGDILLCRDGLGLVLEPDGTFEQLLGRPFPCSGHNWEFGGNGLLFYDDHGFALGTNDDIRNVFAVDLNRQGKEFLFFEEFDNPGAHYQLFDVSPTSNHAWFIFEVFSIAGGFVSVHVVDLGG